MNKRVQKYREKSASYSSVVDPFDPPLMIAYALVSRWGPGDQFSRTQRDTLSLNLITMGNAIFEQEGRHGVVEKGQIFLAQKGCSQTLRTGSLGVMHKRSLILEGAALDSLVNSLHLEGRDIATPGNLTEVTSLFREAYRMLREKPEGLVMQLPPHALRILLACAGSRVPDYPLSLRVAMKYVDANIHKAMTVAGIARVAGLSVRHCTRLFHQHLGCSPMEFCIRQRMALAQSILANTNQPMKHIAASLGYDNQLYFSALFRRRLGVSPSEYRRKRLAGKSKS